MTLEIIASGAELLLGQSVDTNSVYLSRKLSEIGINVLRKQTVGDNLARIAEALHLALQRSDGVIIIGGLGPTEDDLTREAISAVTGCELIQDRMLKTDLDKRFGERNMKPTKNQYRQAMRPANATPLPNPNGTAPGLRMEHEGKIIFALPGPPAELIPMAENYVLPHLAAGSDVLLSRVLRLTGIGEASAEEALKDLLKSDNPTLAPLAHPAEVHFRITAKAESQSAALALIKPLETEVRRRLGDHVYGADDETLEQVVLKHFIDKGATLAVAESCTGGLLANRITNIPGASEVLLGGIIAYSNTAKTNLLKVPADDILTYGAVSEQAATAMAKGVKSLFKSDWGIGITGIAGPSGATNEKPVGLVWIGLAHKNSVRANVYNFIGQREQIKLRATQEALALLRKGVMSNGCDFS